MREGIKMSLVGAMNVGSFSLLCGDEGREFLRDSKEESLDGNHHQRTPISIDGNTIGHQAGLVGFDHHDSDFDPDPYDSDFDLNPFRV
jgi:hypothetical protein